MADKLYALNEWHKKQAIDCFNHTWDLIDKTDRTPDEDARMIHTAHASRYHWENVDSATPLNLARGDWQVSRVHSMVGLGDSALFHAERSLEICLANKYGDFDLAFGYEAMARSYKVLGNDEKQAEFLAKAKEAAGAIAKKDDRDYFMTNLVDL